VVLHRNRFIVTVICATHATFWRGRNVRGNFLRDGAHWEVVHERVITKLSKLRTSDESSSPADKSAKLLIEMPATVSHEVRKAATAASTRLRTERTLAFGHPVLLSAPGYRLRFEPVTTRGRAVELPYSFQRDGGTAVNVALRLKAPNDPMAIRYTDGTDPNELVSAWAAGLAGFAELTCVAAPSQTVERPALETRPERGPQATPRQAAPRHPGNRDGGLVLPVTLRPIGRTIAYAASYVAGHRRRLRQGQSSSAEARTAAAEAGIALREHETWVRPHARGMPDDAALEFAWRPPAELAEV